MVGAHGIQTCLVVFLNGEPTTLRRVVRERLVQHLTQARVTWIVTQVCLVCANRDLGCSRGNEDGLYSACIGWQRSFYVVFYKVSLWGTCTASVNGLGCLVAQRWDVCCVARPRQTAHAAKDDLSLKCSPTSLNCLLLFLSTSLSPSFPFFFLLLCQAGRYAKL